MIFGFGPQTRAEVLRRNEAARGGIIEVASRRSKYVQEAWLSDQKKRVGPLRPRVKWLNSIYLGAKLGLCNSPGK
jgi:hypothetical protein